MSNNFFIRKIQNFKLPLHLNDDSLFPIYFYSNEKLLKEFKILHEDDPISDLQFGGTPDLAQLCLTDRSNNSRISEDKNLKNPKIHAQSQRFESIMHNFMAEDPLSHALARKKVKCTSVDRRSLEDLATSYKSEYRFKDMKRICDINLGILFEDLKRIYLTQKKPSIRVLLANIGQLVTMFIFSSIASLRLNKCRYILQKLDSLENIIHDNLDSHWSMKTSPTLSPIQSTEHETNYFNFNELSNTPKMRKKTSFNQYQAPECTEKQTYKQMLSLIAKVKYTVAQLGHLLHYDCIANPTIREPQVKQDQTSSPGNPNMTLDYEEDKTHSEKSEIRAFLESESKNIKNYYYLTQTFMDDFDESVIKKKIERLNKFCIWKAQKWSKRAMIEKKYHTITCKICESNVKVDKFKDHAELCFKKAKLNKRLRDLDNKLSDIVFYAFIESKALQKAILAESKKYLKLKSKTTELQESKEKPGLDFFRSESFSKPGAKLFQGKSLQATPYLQKKETPVPTPQIKTVLTKNKRRMSVAGLDQQGVIKNAIKLNGDNSASNSKDLNESSGKSSESSPPFLVAEGKPSQFLFNRLPDTPGEVKRASPTRERKRADNKRLTIFSKQFRELHLEEAETMKNSFYSDQNQNQNKCTEESQNNDFADDCPKSARLGSKNESGSPSMSISDSSQNSEKSPPSVIRSDARTLTPMYKKSKFYRHPGTPNNKTSQDENKKRIQANNNLQDQKEPRSQNNMDTGSSDEEDKPAFGLIRRTKTTLGETKTVGAIKAFLNDKKFEEDGQVTQAVKQLKKLRTTIDIKKLKVEIYGVILTKAQLIISQEPSTRDLDLMIKEDVISKVSNSVAGIDDPKIHGFTQNFTNLLTERINCGKELNETIKKIDYLEGKLPKIIELLDNKKPNLIRGYSYCSIPSAKPFKSIVPLKKKFTEEMSPTKQGTANKNFVFNIDLSRQTSNSEGLLLDGNIPLIRGETFAEESPKIIEGEFLPEGEEFGDAGSQENIEGSQGGNMLDIVDEDNNSGDRSIMSKNENENNIPMFKEDSNMGFFNLLSDEPDDRKLQEHYPTQNIASIQMIDQEGQQEDEDNSPSSSGAVESDSNYQLPVTYNNPSIMVIEASPHDEGFQEGQPYMTPDFSSDANKSSLLANLISEKASPATPSFERSSSKQKSSTAPPRSFEEIPLPSPQKNPSDQNPYLQVGKLPFQPTLLPHLGDRFHSLHINHHHHAQSESKDKMKEKNSHIKRLDKNGHVMGQENRAGSPTHEENKISLKTILASTKLFKLEKKEDFDMSRLPSLCPSLTNLDQENEQQEEEDNFFTPRPKNIFETKDSNEEKEKIKETNYESLSSVFGSPIYDREYFSDSEAHHYKGPALVKCPPAIGIHDFEPIKIISKGAFGRVWLVRKKATKDLYAMKVINLAEKLMKNTELDNLKKENNVLSLAQEDFVVRAVFTFTHDTCICFVMEYMLGGDLGDFLYNYCSLEEDVARFYIAEIVLAVEYLHSLGIVHRDLKPDNILLDRNGHAKLTDFGLSEVGLSQKIKAGSQSPEKRSPTFIHDRMEVLRNLGVVGKDEVKDSINPKVKGKYVEKKLGSSTSEEEKDVKSADPNMKRKVVHRLIGTPDYMAPEIINHISTTSYSSDWWSLGVMLFEFLIGIPPFNDETPDKIYDNIINLRIPWDQIPEGSLSDNAIDLINKLLTLDHTKRLGSNGAKEIKQHPFFAGINWETLRKQQAPITFDRIEETDTQNFVRMHDKLNEKEKEDPFVCIPKNPDLKGNLQAAKQFIEHSQENFQRVNIPALYSATLQLGEETIKKKEGELKLLKDKMTKEGPQKFNDVFELPEQ